MIGDVPVLVVETVAIHETMKMIVQLKMDNLIMKKDSQIAINSIFDKIKTPTNLNLVFNMVTLTQNFRNIHFNYLIQLPVG